MIYWLVEKTGGVNWEKLLKKQALEFNCQADCCTEWALKPTPSPSAVILAFKGWLIDPTNFEFWTSGAASSLSTNPRALRATVGVTLVSGGFNKFCLPFRNTVSPWQWWAHHHFECPRVICLWEVITDSIWQVQPLWKRMLRSLRWSKPTAQAPIFNKVMAQVEFLTLLPLMNGVCSLPLTVSWGNKKPSVQISCRAWKARDSVQSRGAGLNLSDKAVLATGCCVSARLLFTQRDREIDASGKKLEVIEMKKVFFFFKSCSLLIYPDTSTSPS